MKGTTYFLLIVAILGVVIFFPRITGQGTGNPTVKPFPTFTDTPDSRGSTRETKATATAWPTQEPPVAIVNVDVLNVRSGPGTIFSILGKVHKGEEFEITGKNPGMGDWLEIYYRGRTGWVHSPLVDTVRSERIQIAQVIPAPPPSANPPVPTSTSRLVTNPIQSERSARCSFHGTMPRIPDPVGVPVNDCDLWDVSYAILIQDRPEVMLGDFSDEARVEMTYFIYDMIRQAASNCNTNEFVVVGLASFAGDMIDSHGNPKDPDVMIAPRVSLLGGLTGISGTQDQCARVMDEWLKDQIGQ